jgi:competence protein ComEA
MLGANRWAVTGVGVTLCAVAGFFVAGALGSPRPADGAPASGVTWDDAAWSAGAEASGEAGAEVGAGAATAAAVVVHVAGAVAAPGVYELPAGGRVVDAIEAAGGAAAGADRAALNLAAVLVDGEQIYVPLPGETPPAVASAGGGSGAGGGAAGADGRVDVNAADAAELESLPGIGPVLAARIVEFRDANGPFGELGDLGEVTGIGPKLLAGLADAVVFG